MKVKGIYCSEDKNIKLTPLCINTVEFFKNILQFKNFPIEIVYNC